MSARKFVTSFMLVAGIGATPALADVLPPPDQVLVDTVTSASTSPAYRALLKAEHDALLSAVGQGNPVTTKALEHGRQDEALADKEWLKGAGYQPPKDALQKAGIAMLSGFETLPPRILAQNDDVVADINNSASGPQEAHALFDAYGQNYAFFPAEALGPKLGQAYVTAYAKGEIKKAAALMKMSEISTGAAKDYFHVARPFLIDGNRIRPVYDEDLAKEEAPYAASGGAFPSGHTNTGYTDSLVLAQMLPERFLPLVARGAGYGYSRVVLGVHYPLDVMGSRMVAQHNVAALLGDAGYQTLFKEAKDELRAALEKECGEPLAACAAAGTPADDPWAAPAIRSFYRYTMTYGLEQPGQSGRPMQVPGDAERLLAVLRPDLSNEVLKDIIVETALPSGYALDSERATNADWQRVNLYEAALRALKR